MTYKKKLTRGFEKIMKKELGVEFIDVTPMTDYEKVVEGDSFYHYSCNHCSHISLRQAGKIPPRCPNCHYALVWNPRLVDVIEANNGEEIVLSDLIKLYQEGKLVEIDTVKKAFWEQFKGVGELFFPYARIGATEDDINSAVEEEWDGMVAELKPIGELK